MRNLLSAEWYKAWSGRTWLIMLIVAVGMGMLGASGAAAAADQQLDKGMTTPDLATAEVIRNWFSALLGSMLFGAVFVSREYSSGAINRSVLMSGGRGRLFLAKLIVGTAMGAVLAAFTALVAPLTAYGFLGMFGIEPSWTGEATRTLIGVASVTVLAGPWGVLLGWLIRNQAATVATALVLTLFVDEGVHALLPEVGRFTMQVALGSVYLDDKDQALSVPFALLVVAGWLALTGVISRWRLVNRDIV